MTRLLCLLAMPLMLLPLGAQATENDVVRCKTSVAREQGQSSGPALIANVPSSMTPISLNAVQFADKKLSRSIVVEGLYARRTPTDSVEVMARLVNCTDKPTAVQARSSFMDSNQAPVEQSSVWKTVFLSPQATGSYQEFSIMRGSSVANYLIELRADQ